MRHRPWDKGASRLSHSSSGGVGRRRGDTRQHLGTFLAVAVRARGDAGTSRADPNILQCTGPPREQARGSQCQASHAEEDEELQKGMTPAPSFISGEDAPKSGTPPHPTSRLPTSVGAGAGVSPTPRVRLRLRVNTRFPRAPAPAACNRGSVPLRGHPGGELLLLSRCCHDPDTLDRELGKGLWTGWTSFTGLLCTQGRNFNDKARCRPDGADRHRSAEHTSWLSPTRF